MGGFSENDAKRLLNPIQSQLSKLCRRLESIEAALGGGSTPQTATVFHQVVTGDFTIPAGTLSYAITNLDNTNGITVDGNALPAGVGVGDDIEQIPGFTRTFPAIAMTNPSSVNVLIQYQS